MELPNINTLVSLKHHRQTTQGSVYHPPPTSHFPSAEGLHQHLHWQPSSHRLHCCCLLQPCPHDLLVSSKLQDAINTSNLGGWVWQNELNHFGTMSQNGILYILKPPSTQTHLVVRKSILHFTHHAFSRQLKAVYTTHHPQVIFRVPKVCINIFIGNHPAIGCIAVVCYSLVPMTFWFPLNYRMPLTPPCVCASM